MTIKRKFLLCAALIFLAVGMIGTATGLQVRENQRAQVNRTLDAVANLETERVAELISQLGDSMVDPVSKARLGPLLAADPPDRAVIGALLSDAVSSSTTRAMVVLDRDGNVLADTSTLGATHAPQGFTAGDAAAAIGYLERGASDATGRAFRLQPQDERFVHVVPIIHRGETVGYLAGECDLRPVQQLVAKYVVVGATAEANLVQRVDDGAQYLADLRFRPDTRFTEVVPADEAQRPEIKALTGPNETFDSIEDYRGTEVVASVRHIPASPWALVVKIDRGEAYGGVNRALRFGTVAFVLTGLLSLAAVLLLSRSVLRRIRRVAESASAISAGQLSARVGDLSGDELGVLARSFDAMADSLVADMARRHRAEAALAHSAEHDALTGLPNRVRFQQELQTALRQETERGTVAVLFCDLDEFKTVNDDLGHSAGDGLLREVAHRLQLAVGPEHVLARFGGDEFVVVARGLHDTREALALAERMREMLVTPISLVGRDVFVTTSVGVAVSQPGSTSETLVRDADAAMYQAKEVGRHRVVLYDESIGARTNNRLGMTTELRRAIAHGGLTMAAQPIVELATGAVHAYEVLVRWRHAGREIDPAEFVMRATELDIAGALDRWVLDEACRVMRSLRDTTGAQAGWLHVNATGTTLVDPLFASDVLRVLTSHRLDPSALCLEIVEDRLGGANDEALETLNVLRRAGVRVAIDDFGTGHSSLARLRALPADTVKIDQSFVRDIATDRASQAIAGSVIALARELGLQVVAEGIEEPRQQEMLEQLGCRFGQGYLLGPPRSVADVVSAALMV